jgi:hypothetical protein
VILCAVGLVSFSGTRHKSSIEELNDPPEEAKTQPEEGTVLQKLRLLLQQLCLGTASAVPQNDSTKKGAGFGPHPLFHLDCPVRGFWGSGRRAICGEASLFRARLPYGGAFLRN